MNETIAYYDQNADAFLAGTQSADMTAQYRYFLEQVSPGCRILDLGCGSGRDSAYFLSRGYAVVAVDGSEELCRRVREQYGIDALCLRFAQLDFAAEFDAVWACASLLHVPRREMPDILRRIAAALRPDGVLYASFKYGKQERRCQGRFFCDYTEAELDALFTPERGFSLLSCMVTEDVRPDHAGEKWLNLLARKK